MFTVGLTCSSCSKAFKRRVRNGKRPVSCPRCGAPMRIPAEVLKAHETPADEGPPGEAPPPPAATPTAPPPPGGKPGEQVEHAKGEETKIGEREEEDDEPPGGKEPEERHAGPLW